MSRYFDPSRLDSVKGSSCEWAKSQTVLSRCCFDCLLVPDAVTVPTDDKLNQAIQPQTAAVVAAHIVIAVREPRLKLRFVVRKFWRYRYDSFHCPDKEANCHVSCSRSLHSADWRHLGKQDGR
jgi:nitric oxide synthase oxygenase domain/subunit